MSNLYVELLLLLNEKPGFGPESPLQAPQATLMSMIVKGVISQQLPWVLLLIGIFIGICVELLGISSLPFAIGLYLPFSLSAPIIIGGLVAGAVTFFTKEDSKEHLHEKGILFSSGLVAGDALLSIILSLFASIMITGAAGEVALSDKLNLRGKIPDVPLEHLMGFGFFIVLAIILIAVIKTGKSKE